MRSSLDCPSLSETLIPDPSPEEMDDLFCEAIRRLNQLGITSIQNMNGDPSLLERYERIRARGDLTLRVGQYAGVWDETPLDYVDEIATLRERHNDPWNHVNGIKIYLDGVVESETALMLQPYRGSTSRGAPAISPEHYKAAVQRAHALELCVATHAI